MKPCPFCTCKAIELETEADGPRADYFWVECPACNACGPLQTSDSLAIDAWNARDVSPDSEARIEFLEAALRKVILHPDICDCIAEEALGVVGKPPHD